jgi:hypothetical protein
LQNELLESQFQWTLSISTEVNVLTEVRLHHLYRLSALKVCRCPIQIFVYYWSCITNQSWRPSVYLLA